MHCEHLTYYDMLRLYKSQLSDTWAMCKLTHAHGFCHMFDNRVSKIEAFPPGGLPGPATARLLKGAVSQLWVPSVNSVLAYMFNSQRSWPLYFCFWYRAQAPFRRTLQLS